MVGAPTPEDHPEWASWQRVFEQIPGPLGVLDLAGNIIYLNPTTQRLSGFSNEELLNKPATSLIHPDDSPEDIDRLVARSIDRFYGEKRVQRKDGKTYWASFSAALVNDSYGEPFFLLLQFQDTTEQHRAHTLWQQTVDHAPIGMALVDLRGRWTEVNDKLCSLLGYRRDELISMHVADLTYGDSSPGIEGAIVALAGEAKQEHITLKERFRHKDGYPIWVFIRISVVLTPDNLASCFVTQYETLGDDATQDRDIAHMAVHDPLTGLANRVLFYDHFRQEVSELATAGHLLALLVIDVDNLKPINDSYGHVAGDRVLTTAAHELLIAAGPGTLVARFGGDEFVILSKVHDIRAALDFRQRISESLVITISTFGNRVNVSASVGIATTQDPRASITELIHRADCDMYNRKKHKSRTK